MLTNGKNNNGSYPGDSGALRQKAQSFKKEIRSERLSLEFASMRKLLFRKQAAAWTSQQNTNQFTRLDSWQQVRQQLESVFMPNYQGIEQFIREHADEPAPKDVEKLLLTSAQRPELLTSEEGMVLLATITNMQKQNAPVLQHSIIRSIVDNLIRSNLVLIQVNGQQVYRLHYFQTLCWVLHCLANVCENNLDQVFQTFKDHLAVFETQSADLSFQLVTLFAGLSTTPSLHPSREFIKHALIKSADPAVSKDPKLMGMLVMLLDNFVRYNYGQAGQRFEASENVEMEQLYIKFIFERMRDMKFPKGHKICLTQLLTTLVKSLSDDVLTKMFECMPSLQLMELIFFNAQFGEWKIKKASLICFCECLCRAQMIQILSRLIGPQAITHLCWNSLLLPDSQIQVSNLCAMFSLCHFMFEVYGKEFRMYNFAPLIKNYELMGTQIDNKQKKAQIEFLLHQFNEKLRRQNDHNQGISNYKEIQI